MDGRRLMNFFSLFFTLLLSESSELLCFSLELLKTSAGSDETAQLGRCRRLLKVTQLLTDGAPVGLVPMLEARGAGRMFGEGSASGQALHAGGPLQGKALLPPLLEGNNHQLWLQTSASHHLLENVLTGDVMVVLMVSYQLAAAEEESAWSRNSLPVWVVICRRSKFWLKFMGDLVDAFLQTARWRPSGRHFSSVRSSSTRADHAGGAAAAPTTRWR